MRSGFNFAVKKIFGYSLVELMVVIALFAILAVVATQTLTLSLRGTKKSESIVEVKNNVEYAMSTMERLLRNAQSISVCTGSTLQYKDELGSTGTFSCDSTNLLIASGSASLINSDIVAIDNCASGPAPRPNVFSCSFPSNSPPVINLKIEASRKNNASLGAEGTKVTSQTKIMLRTY